MAGLFLLLVWGSVAFIFDALTSFILIRYPELDRNLAYWNLHFIYALLFLLGCLFLLWITLFGLAIGGSARQMPLIGQLASKPWVVHLSLIVNSVALAVAIPASVVGFWANSVMKTGSKHAAVYFLYDDGIPVPRWGYALGMSRVYLSAAHKWGAGCTVLAPLNKGNLSTALSVGKVVILATHGQYGFAYTYYAPTVLAIGPPDIGSKDNRNSSHYLNVSVVRKDNSYVGWEDVPVGSDLQLAYIFACYGGQRSAEWKEHLSPAQVISYDRASTLYDHAYWFAIVGPAAIEKLKE